MSGQRGPSFRFSANHSVHSVRQLGGFSAANGYLLFGKELKTLLSASASFFGSSFIATWNQMGNR